MLLQLSLGANNDDDEDPEEPSQEEDFNEVSNDDETTNFLQSFQNRQSQLRQQQATKALNLRQAACTSGVSLVLPDWVRRLDVDYPLAACGSASDDVYVAHLETGQILATTAATSQPDVLPSPRITDERVAHLMHQLYGSFDGGGTLAVAVKGSLLCEARRSGGVHVWRLNNKRSSASHPQQTERAGRSGDQAAADAADSDTAGTIELMAQGFIPSLQDCLVSALRLEDDYLWVATDEGSVEAYAVDHGTEQLPLTLRTQPDLLWKVGRGSGCAVLSLDVNTELGLAVVTTDAGTVELLSLEDEEDEDKPFRKPIGSFVPPFDGSERRSSNVYPTCATIVDSSSSDASADDKSSSVVAGSSIQLNRPKSYSIACGANDGSLFLQQLQMDPVLGDEIDTEQPFPATGTQNSKQQIRTLMPKHFAAVKCLASPAPGLLLTGGLDGTLRLWDIAGDERRQFLYQFVGYKVWLGSLWTDGTRVVTDGADNTVIVHDFSGGAAAASGGSSGSSSSSRPKPEDLEDEDSDI